MLKTLEGVQGKAMLSLQNKRLSLGGSQGKMCGLWLPGNFTCFSRIFQGGDASGVCNVLWLGECWATGLCTGTLKLYPDSG